MQRLIVLFFGLWISTVALGASNNPGLETLDVQATGGATLVPAFAPEQTQYAVRLPSDIRAVFIRGSAWNGRSKLRINDQPATSLNWQRIELKPGANRVVFNVVAADGATSRDYLITVEREDVRLVTDAFLKFVHRDAASGLSMPYRLFLPKGHDSGTKFPLVLFLHGGGQGGSDNEKHMSGNEGAVVWAKPEEQAKRPAFVLAPQARDYVDRDSRSIGGFGITRDRNGDRYMDEVLKPSADAMMALAVLDKVMKDYAVDPRRVYATGLSQGGFGTWNIGLARPDLFAALVPIAGGGDPGQVSRLVSTPVWGFQAEDDRVVPAAYMRNTIDALRRAGGKPIYTELPSGTFFDPNEHWSWVYAYRSDALREWLFNQAR